MTKYTATVIPSTGRINNIDVGANAAIDPSKIAQRVLAEYPVKFTDLRVWNALGSLAATTPATDDLGLITGTFGTDYPTLSTGDLKAAGSTTRKIGFEFIVPPNYDDGETITLRIRAGMETTEADNAATVDVECYAADGDGGVSADLCSTSAQSANSLTLANLDFVINAASVDPSLPLNVTVSFLVNDAGTVTAVTGLITDIRFLIDTRG